LQAFVRYRNGFPPVTAIVAPDLAGKRIGQHDIGGSQFGGLRRALHRNLPGIG